MKPMRSWIRSLIVMALAFAYRRGADPKELRRGLFRVFEERRTAGWCEKLWTDVEEAGRAKSSEG